MDTFSFVRARTELPESSRPKQVEEDPWSESEPPQRSVTVPSAKRTAKQTFSAETTALASTEDNPLAAAQVIEQEIHQHKIRKEVRSIAANILLCGVNLLVGCVMPAVADKSRTATVYGKSDDQLVPIDHRFPYNPAQLVMGEALANVVIGLVAMKFLIGSPVLQLLHLQRQYEMLPLTLIYCVGDIAALGAIGSGGGLLYLTVTNSRLLFAALASKMIMKQDLECFQWGLLAAISTCIVIFAAGHMREDESHHSDGATVALLLALLKSCLSALAAVLTETRYKKMNIWEANTLLKTQSFVVAFVFSQIRYREPLALCPPGLRPELLGEADRCISFRGWDHWTGVVLAAEVSNGWLSVAILTRLSAIAKFVCKAACAPSLYVAYYFFGWNQFKFAPFVSVLVMALSIVLYAKETIEFLWKYVKGSNTWPQDYSAFARLESGTQVKQAAKHPEKHGEFRGSVSSKRIEKVPGP